MARRRWMQVSSSGGCSPRGANVTEIGRADAVNTVPSQYGDFVADSVLYREPVEYIAEDLGWCGWTSQYQQRVSQQRSKPFEVAELLLSRHRIGQRCSNRCGWQLMLWQVFAGCRGPAIAWRCGVGTCSLVQYCSREPPLSAPCRWRHWDPVPSPLAWLIAHRPSGLLPRPWRAAVEYQCNLP